jgi:SLAP domain-containing protein
MNISSKIKLSLPDEEFVAELKRNIYEEELKEINRKFPIYADQIDIKQTYLFNYDESIEVGFFIRNAFDQKISFGELLLVIQDNNGKNIIKQKIDFTEYGTIPPYSARPFSTVFNKDKNIEYDNAKEYTIKFADISAFEGIFSFPTEIENIPIDITYEEEKKLKKFIEEYGPLKKDEFNILFYEITYNNKNNIILTVILRNGTDKEAKLDKLPVTIVDDEGKIILRKLFLKEGGLTKISPRKSKLLHLEFNPHELTEKKIDISKCKVILR